MSSCAGMQRGTEVPIVIDYEETYGEDPGSPAGIQVPYINETISATRAQLEDDVLNGRRDPLKPSQGITDVQGNITVPVDKNYFPYWLKAMFGAPTTSGAGPYTHVFKIDNTNCQPSLVLEKNFSDIPKFFKYNGIKVQSMGFSVDGDGLMQCNIALVGSSLTEGDVAYDASPTTHSYFRYKFMDSALNEGGSANAEFLSLNFDINGNLQTDIYPIGNGGNRSALPEGKFSIGGSGTILFDNMTLYNKAKNATESSLELILSHSTDSLTIDFNEIEYGLSSPQVSGNEGVKVDLSFMAFYDNHADNSAVVFTVVNSIASYA